MEIDAIRPEDRVSECRDRIVHRAAAHVGHGHLFLPGGDEDYDDRVLAHPRAALWILIEDLADRNLVVGASAWLRNETGPAEVLDCQHLLLALDERDADWLGSGQLVLDLRVDVVPGEARADEQEQRERPRPERPVPHRLVVLVVAGATRSALVARERFRAVRELRRDGRGD